MSGDQTAQDPGSSLGELDQQVKKDDSRGLGGSWLGPCPTKVQSLLIAPGVTYCSHYSDSIKLRVQLHLWGN